MLLADPEAALRETRRVLRPGGRIALAVWDEPERQPVAHDDHGRGSSRSAWPRRRTPTRPGRSRSPRTGRVEELLEAAGFDDVEVVEPIDFTFRAPTARRLLWETQCALSSRDARARSPASRPPSTTRCATRLDASARRHSTADDGSRRRVPAAHWRRRRSLHRVDCRAPMFYDDDADLTLLDGKTVAIIGFGSQGHAHALNLKDSGVDVVVGLRAGLGSRSPRPRTAGLEVLDRRRRRQRAATS